MEDDEERRGRQSATLEAEKENGEAWFPVPVTSSSANEEEEGNIEWIIPVTPVTDEEANRLPAMIFEKENEEDDWFWEYEIGQKPAKGEKKEDEDENAGAAIRNGDEEEELEDRYEFEIEASVADFQDEEFIGRNTIHDSSDEDEDELDARYRRSKKCKDKLEVGTSFWSGYEFKEAVLHYALSKGRNIDDVMKKEPKTWSLAYYRLGSFCEDVDNNATESFNSTITGARAKAVVPMLETIRRQAMLRIAKRHKKSERRQKKFTKYVVDMLESEKEDADKCVTVPGTHGVFDVRLSGNTYDVNTTRRTCTCGKWQITGIPCEHAYGAMIDVGLDVEDYVSEFFSTDLWRMTYSESISTIRGPRFWMKKGEYNLVVEPPEPATQGKKGQEEGEEQGEEEGEEEEEISEVERQT